MPTATTRCATATARPAIHESPNPENYVPEIRPGQETG